MSESASDRLLEEARTTDRGVSRPRCRMALAAVTVVALATATTAIAAFVQHGPPLTGRTGTPSFLGALRCNRGQKNSSARPSQRETPGRVNSQVVAPRCISL
jgi:hypothetical protein